MENPGKTELNDRDETRCGHPRRAGRRSCGRRQGSPNMSSLQMSADWILALCSGEGCGIVLK